MRLYDFKLAPSPRRVRVFAAEKGIALETVSVDLRGGGQFEDGFRAVNARCAVPVLELDDGTRINESVAICRYLEETHPEPPLMGTDPRDKAIVEMWQRQVEIEGFTAVAEALRNSVERLKDRALIGPVPHAQIPELAARGRARIGHFFEMLDGRLSECDFVAGDRFTIADITAMVTIDFASRVEVTPPGTLTALKAWYERVSARPSAAA